jgi:ribosomal protein L37E
MFERSMTAENWKGGVKCPKCGKMAYQDLVTQHSSGGVDSQMREYEFYGSNGTRMYAASYLPNQIDEARKKHPGTDFKLHNGCYIPVIKNRRHKLKFLKERNFVEF